MNAGPQPGLRYVWLHVYLRYLIDDDRYRGKPAIWPQGLRDMG